MRLEYVNPTQSYDSSLQQSFAPDIAKTSPSSLSVKVNTVGMPTPANITSYRVYYQRMTDKKTPAESEQIVNSASNPVSITNLTQNALYKITTQALSATGFGNTLQLFYNFSTSTVETSKVGTPKTPGKVEDAKSYLKITGGSSVDDKYTLAYRTFQSLQLPASTTQFNNEAAFPRSMKNYSTAYYSFGTTILMPSLITGYEAQGGGIGFFLNADSGSGYFITAETTGTAANSNTKPIKIFKLRNKQIMQLETSQKGNTKTLDTVMGGTTYNIDVKVKIEAYTINITAYINGFKVTASDTSNVGGYDILEPTQIVGLLGTSGTTMFDYVYGETIDATRYDSPDSLNFYQGQFSKDYLQASFGDLVYEFNNEDTGNDSISQKSESYDEFGTVVREIAQRKIKLSGRPSFPVKFTTGVNKLVSILSETKSNFSAEAFVLNNSSVTAPLADDRLASFSIGGYDIAPSGDLEYITDPLSENITKEPVIFESKWLQNQDDVKRLADWIKGRVVNKSKIIEMEVFGNPIISVGDIITVDYAYQGFTSAQKIIVVKISHRYNDGLTTQVIGRTL